MAQNLSQADQEQIAQARAAALTQAEEAFAKLDINGDGEVDRTEITALAGDGLPAGCDQATKDAKIKEFLDSFDTDGDGKIQKAEWLNFFGQLFDSVISAGLGAQ